MSKERKVKLGVAFWFPNHESFLTLEQHWKYFMSPLNHKTKMRDHA